MKKIYLTGLAGLMMFGCVSQPATQTKKEIPSNKQNIQVKSQSSVNTAPESYVQWLAQHNNSQRMLAYRSYLEKYQVDSVVPMFELLRSARSWQVCGRDEYNIPTTELWPNIVNTLLILKYLNHMGILKDFEVTSVYRDAALNECAGGAKASKHVVNGAIDFRIGVENASSQQLLEAEITKGKLCQFWEQYGQQFNMGLGVYRSGQIHIDTQGFRTWGSNLTRESSPCYYQWLRLNSVPITQ